MTKLISLSPFRFLFHCLDRERSVIEEDLLLLLGGCEVPHWFLLITWGARQSQTERMVTNLSALVTWPTRQVMPSIETW
jgi:hypothetical protein